MKDYKLIKNYKANDYRKVLFCFPYAGGGATAYKNWMKALERKVNVCPIQLPGREERIIERAYTEMSALVVNLADTLEEIIEERECYFFGHSMGGKIAYETALELFHRGKSIEHLFISGCEAPHIAIRNPIAHLSNTEFKREVMGFAGIPEEIYENKELFNFFIPILRTDFILSENYRGNECNTLECPISVFYGEDDPEATYEEAVLWQKYTRDEFNIEAFRGNHFFIKTEENAIWQSILEAMYTLKENERKEI